MTCLRAAVLEPPHTGISHGWIADTLAALLPCPPPVRACHAGALLSNVPPHRSRCSVGCPSTGPSSHKIWKSLQSRPRCLSVRGRSARSHLHVCLMAHPRLLLPRTADQPVLWFHSRLGSAVFPPIRRTNTLAGWPICPTLRQEAFS